MKFLFVCFLFTQSHTLFASPRFDKAETKRIQLGKSQLGNGDIVLKSSRYKTLTVLEINDPGEKGAREIYIHTANQTLKKLNHFEGYVWGVVGELIFLQSADSFGNGRGFQVINSSNGAILYESTYDIQSDFKITNYDLEFFKLSSKKCLNGKGLEFLKVRVSNVNKTSTEHFESNGAKCYAAP